MTAESTQSRRPVRLAVVGAGMIGQAHIQRVLAEPEAELAAIIDPSPRAQDQAQQLQCWWSADVESLLEAGKAEGVVLATPNQLHRVGALACIRADVPALVEKPVAESLASAMEIVQASEASGVPILVGHHRRHSPLIANAKTIVESGQLGSVTAVVGMCLLRKPDDYFDVAWRREPGGGVILINLIHVIDDLRNICGDIVSVQAAASNAARGFPVEDTAAILLRFASGALGTLTISDSAAGPWSWELTAGENKAYPHTDQSCYLVCGTKGSLSVPRLDVWQHADGGAWFDPITCDRQVMPEQDPLTLQMRHFCAVVRGEAKPLLDARGGTRTLETALAITRAAETGQIVTLS